MRLINPESEPHIPVCHRARWLVPVTSPIIEQGAVIMKNGRIVEAGKGDLLTKHFSGQIIDHGECVIFPAFVNVHTHLELSWTRGLLPEGKGFVTWLHNIVSLISGTAHDDAGKVERKNRAVLDAVHELRDTGTRAVGDIFNTSTVHALIRRKKGWPLAGVCFREIICPSPPEFTPHELKTMDGIRVNGCQLSEADITPSLSAHSPYSVHPDAIRIIKNTVRRLGLPFSIHVSESLEEREFMVSGSGSLCAFLSEKRGEDASGSSPGLPSVKFLERLKILDRDTICVHCVHIDHEEMEILAANRSTACLCPQSNRFMETGTAPVSALFRAGVRVAIGTDSLASNHNLSMPGEMALLADMAPDIQPELIFRAATINGAEALGIASLYGSIEAGKKAALAVQSAELSSEKAVMEYLVSGMAMDIKKPLGRQGQKTENRRCCAQE